MMDQALVLNHRNTTSWSFRYFMWAVLFTAVYIATVLLLHSINLRTQSFNQPGIVYPVHHFLLFVLGLYLTWLFYVIGQRLVRLVNYHHHLHHWNGLNNIILCGLLGMSVVQLCMILIGFLGLLYVWVALTTTALILFFTAPRMRISLRMLTHIKINKINKPIVWLDGLLVFYLGLTLCYLFFAKVLLPTLDWDTIMHYNQYFMEVLRIHKIYPNNIWYHYFYSKGAGAFLLGILLSDQDGHKLITYIALIYACLALWSLLSVHRSLTLTLSVIIAYLGIFVSNNWYIFDKQHVMMSCMIIGLLWSSMQYSFADVYMQRILTYASNIILIATIVFVPTTAGLFLPVYGLGALFFTRRKNLKEASYFLSLCITTAVTLMTLLIINYVTSGMLEINPVEPFFHWSNQKKLSEWMSPYMVIWLIEGFPPKLTSFSYSFHFKELQHLAQNLLHLNEFNWIKPLKYLPMLFFAIYLIRVKLFPRIISYQHIKLMCSILILIGVGFAMSLIMNQPISIARFFIFTTPLLLLLFATLMMIANRLLVYPKKRNILIAIVAIFFLSKTIYTIRSYHTWKSTVLPFVLGQVTYEDVYQKKYLFSSDAHVARRLVGFDERILTSNPMHQSYAIPGRPMEVELNYSYRDWHTMVFADASRARKAYEHEGINYFYFDFSYPINGMMPFSSLFATESILSNLRVVWHSQDAYLLTWRLPSGSREVITVDCEGWHSNNLINTNRQLISKLYEESLANCLDWRSQKMYILNRLIVSKKSWHSVEEEFAYRLANNTNTNIVGKALYERVKLYWLRNHGATFSLDRDSSLPGIKGLY